MMDSTWAMASWERRVPMLIFVMGLVLVLVVLTPLLAGSVGEDGAAMFSYSANLQLSEISTFSSCR